MNSHMHVYFSPSNQLSLELSGLEEEEEGFFLSAETRKSLVEAAWVQVLLISSSSWEDSKHDHETRKGKKGKNHDIAKQM